MRSRQDISLILLDLGLPDIGGIEVLSTLKKLYPQIPIIILTGSHDISDAVTAMKMGAYDFLSKPPIKERLEITIQNALKTSFLEKEIQRITAEKPLPMNFTNLIGHDTTLSSVVKLGRKASASNISVMLTGETGTGKEVFAKAIHGESKRTAGPFVAVNCGAIPENLIESILFGHEKGAFTGALNSTLGKFREADGGTIFLDEIGDLPFDAQVKLLRVLQEMEVTPVGGTSAIPINVRVISSTHKDLESAIKSGNFREDLFFRLNVLSIHLPPLRQRINDIPALSIYFAKEFCKNDLRPERTIGPDAIEYLKKQPWRGNVRELENAIHRAIVLAEDTTISIRDFALNASVHTYEGHNINQDYIPRRLADIERETIEAALLHHQGNIIKTANSLGLAKSTLYRKIADFEAGQPF